MVDWQIEVTDRPDSRVVAIVQARLGSVRLPGKVLHPILGRPALEILVERLGSATLVSDVALAIPETPANDELANFAAATGMARFRLRAGAPKLLPAWRWATCGAPPVGFCTTARRHTLSCGVKK